MTLSAALGSHPGFSHLSPDDFEALAYAFAPRSLRAGDVLFEEGDAATEVAIVLSGELDMERERGPRTVTFGRTGPGALLGLVAILGGRRSATCRAVGKVEAAVAPAAAFHLLLGGHSPFSLAVQEALACQLAEDFRRLSDRLVEGLAASVSQ